MSNKQKVISPLLLRIFTIKRRLFHLRQIARKGTRNAVPDIKAFRQRMNAKRSKESGQGMTEYLIIVALVSLAAFAVYQYLGATISHKTAAIAKSIAGQDSTTANTAAANAAKEAENAATNAIAKGGK